MDVIGTKALRVFLLAIHSHYSGPSKSCFKLVCHVNIVFGTFKSENSQDYAQNPQRNCTFMNSASIYCSAIGRFQYLYFSPSRICTTFVKEPIDTGSIPFTFIIGFRTHNNRT